VKRTGKNGKILTGGGDFTGNKEKTTMLFRTNLLEGVVNDFNFKKMK